MGNDGVFSLLASRASNKWRLVRCRAERSLSFGPQEPEHGFFDSYPRFYSTSVTTATPNRLNRRHEALIAPNEAIIRGKSVLDIASHDGRWSFAAHKAGARHVLGIEAREHLVNNAQSNMREYQAPEGQVHFVLGDVFEELDRFEPGSFDTVFCFGFFYHTLHHMLLLSKIARLEAQHLIMDTSVSLLPGRAIRLREDNVQEESAGAIADPGDAARSVVGVPNKPALEMMLASSGFKSIRYYEWRQAGIKRWAEIEDYQEGRRVSLVAAYSCASPEQ